MFIMSQNEKSIISTAYIMGYEVKDGDVLAVVSPGKALLLGSYTPDRAEEILMDIFINIENFRYQMPYM